MWVATNIGAGSGPSATVLRTIIYYLLKKPEIVPQASERA